MCRCLEHPRCYRSAKCYYHGQETGCENPLYSTSPCSVPSAGSGAESPHQPQENKRDQGSTGELDLVRMWPRLYILSQRDVVPQQHSSSSVERCFPMWDSFCGCPAQSYPSHELLALESHSLGRALSSLLLRPVLPSRMLLQHLDPQMRLAGTRQGVGHC